MGSALAYAARGWPILPTIDKKPMGGQGLSHATTDSETIRSWWSKWPNAEPAVACRAAGLVVIDVDDDEMWARTLDGVADGCGLIAATPRGGRHCLYSAGAIEVRSVTGWRTGIDLKAGGGKHGGYIVLPSGQNSRAWTRGDPMNPDSLRPVPDWLMEILPTVGGPQPAPACDTAPCLTHLTQRDDRAEVASALWAIPPSTHRSSWFNVIMAVHARLDGAPWGRQLVEHWSSSSTLILKDGEPQYQPGEASSLYDDALSPQYVRGRAPIHAGTLFAMAREHGWRDLAPPMPVLTIGAPRLHSPSAGVLPEKGADGLFPGGSNWDPDALAPGHAMPSASDIRFTDWQDLLSVPPIEYLVEGWLPEAATVVFAGAPTAGKSLQVVDWMMRLAHSMPWNGNAATGCSSLYLCGEGQQGIAARLRAWKAQHLPPPTEHYVMISSRIPAIADEEQGERILVGIIDKIAMAKGHPPGLVVVDTLSQAMAGGDENGSDVVPLLNNLAAIRDRYGCTTMAVHHLRKPPNQREGARDRITLDAVRGSGAIVGNVDTVIGADRLAGADVEMLILKQKDGRADLRARGSITVVETGAFRRNGAPEQSAILVSTPQQTPVDPGILAATEQAALISAIDENATEAVRALKALGGIAETKSDIAAVMTGRRAERFVAVNRALTLGSIIDEGKSASPRFRVAAGEEERTKEASREPGTDVPVPVPAGPGNQSGTAGNRELSGTLDEGQPEQPRRRRQRKGGAR
ncbi:MAG: AAA family ATPase [Planctomycetes bacterium]|nr:AAA family ATPase [Planctomycetota bacterium]